MSKEGTKNDSGKPKVNLLITNFIFEMARVLTKGAAKNGAFNWVKLHKDRMRGALLRHVLKTTNTNAVVNSDDFDGLEEVYTAVNCMFCDFFDSVRSEREEEENPETHFIRFDLLEPEFLFKMAEIAEGFGVSEENFNPKYKTYYYCQMFESAFKKEYARSAVYAMFLWQMKVNGDEFEKSKPELSESEEKDSFRENKRIKEENEKVKGENKEEDMETLKARLIAIKKEIVVAEASADKRH